MRRIRTGTLGLRQAGMVVALLVAGVGLPVANAASATPAALSGPQVLGWGFNTPHGCLVRWHPRVDC